VENEKGHTMANDRGIREGMQVYGAGDRLLGTVERVREDGFDVAGEQYAQAAIARIAQNRVYVRDAGVTATRSAAATGQQLVLEQTANTIRVPIAEERLTVGTRQVTLGEAKIRKTVVEEQQTVPVTLTHEEVHIEEVAVAERPATGAMLFKEETIRVALRGEEAVVTKTAFVTGEIVIEKDAVAEERQVTDTVRKQRVDVDEAYRQARTGFEQAYTASAAATGRTFEQAEPNYRAGFTAAHDERYAGREFEDAESDLRTQHTAEGQDESIWAQLRQDIRAGWNKARGL